MKVPQGLPCRSKSPQVKPDNQLKDTPQAIPYKHDFDPENALLSLKIAPFFLSSFIKSTT
jgi:hypothetical protein